MSAKLHAYPGADTPFGEIAWEWLRRSPNYRADFARLAAVAAADATDIELRDLHDELARRWAVRVMRDPADDRPPIWRVGRANRNRRWHADALRVTDALAAGASRRELAAELWPRLDEDARRERLRYALARGEELMAGDYRDLVPGNGQDALEAAGTETSKALISPSAIAPCTLSSDQVVDTKES